MNRSVWCWFAEGGLLLLVILVSMGLSSVLRRRLVRREGGDAQSPGGVIQAVLAGLLFPLFALGLGLGVLWLPDLLNLSWAGEWPAAHRSAWHLFWVVVLLFNLLEAVAVQISIASHRFQLPALLRGVLRVVVIALAAFFVLRYELGLNITPLLASTALVTAVVGFALQGVLGNLLAGMSLNLTGSLSKRDWVVVDGVEGQVDEMNWRETWVITRENIPVRIPNSKVADAHILNLSRPEGPRRCSVFVDASYDDPPDQVIAAILRAARAVPEVRRMPAPTAMVEEYKSYGVGYHLWIWLDRYSLREPVQAEVRRHIWYQFRRSGIQIPYPVSDQVLNQFMERAIVPAQALPDRPGIRRQVQGLMQSGFVRQILRDENGEDLIPESELEEWAAGLEVQPFGRGEILFRQGDEGDCCYVILSGCLEGKILHRESGKESCFELAPGMIVGEMSLLSGLPRTAEIRVRETAELLMITAEAFAELLEKQPGVPERLSRLVAERAAANREQMENLLAEDAPELDEAVSQQGILQRFWRMLGRGAGA